METLVIAIQNRYPRTTIEICFHRPDSSFRVLLTIGGREVAKLLLDHAQDLSELIAKAAERAERNPRHTDREALVSPTIGAVGVDRGAVFLKRADTGQFARYPVEAAKRLAQALFAYSQGASFLQGREVQKYHSSQVVQRLAMYNRVLHVTTSMQQYERLGD